MPIIVDCPSCQGKLRISDDLLGAKVRCPACDATFDSRPSSASDPASEPPAKLGDVSQSDPLWKDLSLEPQESSASPLSTPEPSVSDLPDGQDADRSREDPGQSLASSGDSSGESFPPDSTEKAGESEPAPEPEKVQPWPNLSLDLDGGGTSSGGLRGAVELPLEPGSGESRAPSPRQDDSPRPHSPPPWRPPPSAAEPRDENLQACPSCRRYISREARRCYHCGERVTPPTERGQPPWRRPEDHSPPGVDRRLQRGDSPFGPGMPRRDAIPHRGNMVLVLGILSVVLTVLWCLPIGMILLPMPLGLLVPGVIPLILGLCAWVLGQGDLAKMHRQEMDPSGDGTTRAGWICGIVGTVLNTLICFSCVGLFLMFKWHPLWNKPPRPGGGFGPPTPGKPVPPPGGPGAPPRRPQPGKPQL